MAAHLDLCDSIGGRVLWECTLILVGQLRHLPPSKTMELSACKPYGTLLRKSGSLLLATCLADHAVSSCCVQLKDCDCCSWCYGCQLYSSAQLGAKSKLPCQPCLQQMLNAGASTCRGGAIKWSSHVDPMYTMIQDHLHRPGTQNM